MEKRILKKLQNEELKILDYILKICKENNIKYFLVGGTLLGSIRHQGFIPWDDDIDIGMLREDYNRFIEIVIKDDNKKFKIDCNRVNKNYWLPFCKIRNIKTVYKESVLQDYEGNCGIWVDIFPIDTANKDNSIIKKFRFRIVALLSNIIRRKNKFELKKDNIVKKVIFSILCLIPNKVIYKIQEKIMIGIYNKDSKYLVNLGSQYGERKQTHMREKYFPLSNVNFERRDCYIPSDYDYVLKKIYGEKYMQLPPEEKRVTHNPSYIKFEDGEEVYFNEKI